MVGVARRSGKPPIKRAGLPAEQSVMVESWPWTYDEIPWEHQEIWNHVVTEFEALGITRNQSDVDFVVQLVDNYWQKQFLTIMINESAKDFDVKIFKEASSILRVCNEKICAARIKLGIGKNATVQPRPSRENVIDFNKYE